LTIVFLRRHVTVKLRVFQFWISSLTRSSTGSPIYGSYLSQVSWLISAHRGIYNLAEISEFFQRFETCYIFRKLLATAELHNRALRTERKHSLATTSATAGRVQCLIARNRLQYRQGGNARLRSLLIRELRVGTADQLYIMRRRSALPLGSRHNKSN